MTSERTTIASHRMFPHSCVISITNLKILAKRSVCGRIKAFRQAFNVKKALPDKN